MFIIPVLDLLNQQVVQGFRGEREKYRPVQSVLTDAVDPLAVARALQFETQCRAFYIADLDAIQKQGDHRTAIQRLARELDADLWVDAGVTDVTAARDLLQAGAHKVIIGSETLPGLSSLHAIQEVISTHHLLFSLDIAGDQVLSEASALKGQAPLAVLELLIEHGLSQFIILTLDRVGTGGGPAWSLLNSIRQTFPTLFLVAGGGVRTPGDLDDLVSLGVDGVLVASALHRGWITKKDLAPFSPTIQ